MTKAITRTLLGKIVDEVFGGAIEDARVIEEIYAVIKREDAVLSAAESANYADTIAAVKNFAHWHHLNEWTIKNGRTPSDSEIDFEVEAFRKIEKAVKATPASSVAVKALEWNPYRAETPFGWYQIDDQRSVPESELKGRPPFLLFGSRLDYSRHPTLEAARAAAQADYEARIRSALSAQVQDVAGWQLVPIKPTKDMAYAAACAHYGKKRVDQTGIEGISMTVNGIDYNFPAAFRRFWKGALAAAPAKQEGCK